MRDALRDIEKELGLDEALAMEASILEVRLDTRRYGKSMTIIHGFDPSVDVDRVARDLKSSLGVGGTVKEGHVELQGDHRRQVRALLEKAGFRLAPP